MSESHYLRDPLANQIGGPLFLGRGEPIEQVAAEIRNKYPDATHEQFSAGFMVCFSMFAADHLALLSAYLNYQNQLRDLFDLNRLN